MNTTSHNARRLLDAWAVDTGYNDFDTYLATGGSILGCRDDLIHRRDNIDQVLRFLHQLSPPLNAPPPAPCLVIGEDALRRAEAEVTGDPEPNAHAQGAEA